MIVITFYAFYSQIRKVIYLFTDSPDTIPNKIPITNAISHPAIISPAFVPCEPSFKSQRDYESLLFTTIAPTQTPKNDQMILYNILLNFNRTILKSD